jgi:hypothetical protein
MFTYPSLATAARLAMQSFCVCEAQAAIPADDWLAVVEDVVVECNADVLAATGATLEP